MTQDTERDLVTRQLHEARQKSESEQCSVPLQKHHTNQIRRLLEQVETQQGVIDKLQKQVSMLMTAHQIARDRKQFGLPA